MKNAMTTCHAAFATGSPVDARPFHIDGAGRPADRDAQRDQQADEARRLRERPDQDRHAGDAQHQRDDARRA